ncbi:MAG: ATP-binding cassette domain-containing protein [Spirochaetes bacterium]|nr:ATP-binding cassette domain-containing protein [Spirochaetota bacterium]
MKKSPMMVSPGEFLLCPCDLTPALRLELCALFPPAAAALIEEISFEAQERFLDLERRFDDGDFTEGGIWEGTPLRDFLHGYTAEKPAPASRGPMDPAIADWVDRLSLAPHLPRGIKFLSTGEFRKALLIRAIHSGTPAILLHEVYEGLDTESRRHFTAWLEGQAERGIEERPALIFLTRNPESAPPMFRRMLTRVDGGWALGERPDPGAGSGGNAAGSLALDLPIPTTRIPSRSLVAMRGVRVHYGERPVIDRLDLDVATGDHTLILGPNGSGKTTLVNLITGDCPQVYANDVSLFGRRRGTGETIWEIKARLGHVSQALHLDYLHRGNTSLVNVLVSGFHDSIGLYEEASFDQGQTALRWLEALGLADRKNAGFGELPYGEQRLLLVARAAIKSPELLILDEACQGLERGVRRRVLDFVDRLAAAKCTTVLSITHDPEEYLACSRQTLMLWPNGIGKEPAWRLLKTP